ncbi:nucleotide exchange factor GrpE [Salinisphaera sp. USBA-960]|uniref:nucleotide exchange factor GrpE n=1 Tax=Salinisphaera orenii TaxID=856731 RepID=UPI000DBE4A72|nr:nucleotide exchange factor GrpE [Salifodinibacter halophilus]NNC25515.1 nucleotide exchange factor GrpE [Salifodinibacter halophilus]
MTQHQDPSNADPSVTPDGEQDVADGLTPEPDVENDDTVEQKPDDGAAPDSVAATDELQAELDQARAEAEQYRDQLARLNAEMENVRKRSQRDVESARKFAVEKFASDLLEVRDSLEMGLNEANRPDADFSQFYDGMELTRRNFAASMEKVGIEVVNPEGEAFDPGQHEAVTAQPTSDYAPNTITAVMQKGYLLNGRVLRAAKVVVAKAPADDQ